MKPPSVLLPSRLELESALAQDLHQLRTGSQFHPHSMIGIANVRAALLIANSVDAMQESIERFESSSNAAATRIETSEQQTAAAVTQLQTALLHSDRVNGRLTLVGIWLAVVGTIATLIQAAPIVKSWLR